MNWNLSVVSKEQIQATITSPKDPTGLTVAFAFTLTDTAVGAQWYTGSWDGPAVLQDDGSYRAVAQCLIGPNGGEVELSTGAYVVWVRISDNPEVPVKRAGVAKLT